MFVYFNVLFIKVPFYFPNLRSSYHMRPKIYLSFHFQTQVQNTKRSLSQFPTLRPVLENYGPCGINAKDISSNYFLTKKDEHPNSSRYGANQSYRSREKNSHEVLPLMNVERFYLQSKSRGLLLQKN